MLFECVNCLFCYVLLVFSVICFVDCLSLLRLLRLLWCLDTALCFRGCIFLIVLWLVNVCCVLRLYWLCVYLF